MRRLDRYILAEILGPLALGFLVYTFIMLIQVLFRSADLIIGSGVSVETVGRLLLLSLPWIVVMTIPMSLLFGILIGVGRLSTDSELVAIRASGVSLFSLYRPILLLSAVLMAANVYLMLEVLPQGNHALQKLRIDILAQSLTEEVEPRVPHTGWQGKMLYVFESPAEERRWRGTVLADAIPTVDNQLIVAEWGRANADEESGQVLLDLEDVYAHRVELDKPADYQFVHYEQYRVVLASQAQQHAVSVRKSLRELSLPELRKKARDPSVDENVKRLAEVEIHKRFGFPAACLVFGLLALPLGFSNARGGRSSGFALSIGVVLVYYIIFNAGEEAARDGAVEPWLAVWLPNILMLLAGLFLLGRRNRDKSLVLQNVDRLIQEHLWSRLRKAQRSREERQRQRQERTAELRRRTGPGRPQLVLRLPEMRLRFPNSADRYILARFFNVLLLALFSGLTVYLVADLTENVEDILKNEIPTSVVVDYYQYKSFAILYEIAPIIVLVTTLTTFGLLSRTNEITAFKAIGVSLYRLAVPVVVASAQLASLAGVLQSEVLPASNARVAELKARIKGQQNLVPAGRRADRQWLYGAGNQLYNYSFYDPERRELQNLQIFRFDEDYRLIGRLMVERATHIEGPWWTFTRGWARTFEGKEISGFSQFDEPMKYRLEESPEYFEGGLTPPDEMRYADLEAYIEQLRSSGVAVPNLEVELHNKVAYPVISLVMALVALPFAFRLGRRGALYGIGLSLVLGIVLLVVLSVFQALGNAAVLPAAVAIWSPAAIFSIFSLYLFLGVRS
ncbi:MAG: LPS export ABC transporter permease LptF [Holophagales bacterium]|nr:LPS export ABC transporter permease LptF [Holophagales bacterium]